MLCSTHKYVTQQNHVNLILAHQIYALDYLNGSKLPCIPMKTHFVCQLKDIAVHNQCPVTLREGDI